MSKSHRNDPRKNAHRQPGFTRHKNDPNRLAACALRRKRIFAEVSKRHATMAEVALAHGISRQRVHQIVKAESIRRAIENHRLYNPLEDE